MNTKPQVSKSDVLHAFSIEVNPNTDTLATYLQRYPQFREALIDLSIELYKAPSFDDVPVEAVPSENAKRAWSTFQSMLNSTDPAASVPHVEENPLSNLSEQSFRDLARELNVNRLFLTRLRDCSIQVGTIPQQFLRLLAELLSVSVEVLQRSLEAPPTVASGLRHKAAGKPSAGDKITFEYALANSGLSEAQQSDLRAMKDL